MTNKASLFYSLFSKRNPLRANLVKRAEEGENGSAWARQQKQVTPEWLAKLKEPSLPRQWRAMVNKPQTDAERSAVRKCVIKRTPLVIPTGPAIHQ